MRVEGVFENDGAWEAWPKRYRVYLFERPGPGYGWTTDTYDIFEADAVGVIAWAEDKAGEHMQYAVAAVHDPRVDLTSEAHGLIWLVGYDLNASELDENERRAHETMERRQGRLIARD